MPHHQKQNPSLAKQLSNTIKIAYYATFLPNGFDNETLYVKKKDTAVHLKVQRNNHGTLRENYFFSPHTHLAMWLGLPHRMLNFEEQSGRNLLYNFLGWQKGATRLKKIFNYALTPISVLINMINIPFRIVINITKIFTEAIPLAIKDILLFSVQKIDQGIKRIDNGFLRTLAYIGLAFPLYVAAFAAHLVYYIGRSITSPFKNIRSAWKTAQETFGSGISGKIIGVIFAAAAIVPTIVSYSLLFPLIAQLSAAYLTPFLLNHLPPVITQAAVSITKAMSPLLTKIAQTFIPIVTNFVDIIFPGTQIFLINFMKNAIRATGLGIISSFGIPTIGNMAYTFIEEFKSKWYAPISPPILENLDSSDDESDSELNEQPILGTSKYVTEKLSSNNGIKSFHSSSSASSSQYSGEEEKTPQILFRSNTVSSSEQDDLLNKKKPNAVSFGRSQ